MSYDRIRLKARVPGALFVGGAPRWAYNLPRADLLILAARDHQPPDVNFDSIRVMRVPLDDVDEPVSPQDYASMLAAARAAAAAIRRGKVVVSTCQAGLNRSCLIAGMAMRLLGMSADDTVNELRRARGSQGLSNQMFEGIVRRTFPL